MKLQTKTENTKKQANKPGRKPAPIRAPNLEADRWFDDEFYFIFSDPRIPSTHNYAVGVLNDFGESLEVYSFTRKEDANEFRETMPYSSSVQDRNKEKDSLQYEGSKEKR